MPGVRLRHAGQENTHRIMHNAAGITYPAAYVSTAIPRHLAARTTMVEGLNPAAARKSPVETFIARRDEARRKLGL
jgi:hypothetical protein